jgi:carbohydrate kinase (thermoresistant glucokinase family)
MSVRPAAPEPGPKRPMVERPHAIIVMGVSGVGKTTIAKRLAKDLGWTFRDGDAFHPQANIDKMSRGEPLTDDDRGPWLEAIADWLGDCRKKGVNAIVTCSALKRRYRQILVKQRADVRIVHLHGTRELIGTRLQHRKGHFMPPSLLDSQFATLEMPDRSERVVTIDVAMPPSRCVERIIQVLGLK